MKSVDNDDITITGKNGQKIKGSSLALKKKFQVEVTESGFPIEEQIKIEMIRFAEEVGDEEMGS